MRNTSYIKHRIDEMISIEGLRGIGSERRRAWAERKIIGIYYLGNDTPQREHMMCVSKLRPKRWLRQEGQ